jgi:hypothetical protein
MRTAAFTYVVDRGAANWCWRGSNRRGALRNEALLAIRASLTSKMKNPAEAGLNLKSGRGSRRLFHDAWSVRFG